MKTVKQYGDFILTVAGAALRCGRYVFTLKRRKKKDLFDIGYHMGKLYAYHWICCNYGLGASINKNDPKCKDFLKDHKGYVSLFPGLNMLLLMVMPLEFFNEVIKFELKIHGKKTVDKIKAKCKKIK